MVQSMPDDLQALLRDLDAADQEARQMAESLSEAQLNWQPADGKAWSVAQCLDHLAQVNTLYSSALRSAVRDAGAVPQRHGPIKPGWFARWFIRAMEPPRGKFKAQKKVLPAAHGSGSEVLRAFLTAHDGIRSLIYDAREMDLNRIRFTSPFIRLFHFPVGTGLLVIGAHDRRHLWQASQVLRAMKIEPAGGFR